MPVGLNRHTDVRSRSSLYHDRDDCDRDNKTLEVTAANTDLNIEFTAEISQDEQDNRKI